jgi:hypothetical protein
MANLDVIRNAVPGGNIAKPLMIARLGLLASGALFKSGGTELATKPQPPPAMKELEVYLPGWEAFLSDFSRAARAM